MPLFTVVDARKLWESIEDCPHWIPNFLYCGSFDYKLEAFPVKTKGGSHYLWIPVEWKVALRFLNHVIYCMWNASLDQRLPDKFGYLARMGRYAEHLRSGFFDEVLEYWYRPGTQLPTNERPTRQNYPLHSCYLTSFLVDMFNTDVPFPRRNASRVGSEGWKSDPATLDWERWAMKHTTARALYGALPDVGTAEYKLLLAENRVARIPNTPSVEIDSSSWSRFASELIECVNQRRRHSVTPTVPSRRPHTAESDANESLALPEPKAKRRRIA